MRIFEAVCTALREDGHAGLATIVGTTGSTPAPSQSRMLIRWPDGARSVGTVGGGCLDESIRWCLTEDPARAQSRVRSFELNDELGDTGLICGGTVHVLLETLDASALSLFEAIITCYASGQSAFLVTTVHPDGSAAKTLLNSDGALIAGKPLSDFVLDALLRATQNETPMRFKVNDETIIIEPLLPDSPLFIFGGGHVGKVVSQCAALAGFEVTVVDDRETFANRQRFPEAQHVLCEDFETALQHVNLTTASYVVIVTRGHKHDEFILEQTLRHDPKYVGMIGSKRKVLLTLRHLETRGVPPEKLATVHAPIGLPIGALTAGEIGVSIVAELIAERRHPNRRSATRHAELKIKNMAE